MTLFRGLLLFCLMLSIESFAQDYTSSELCASKPVILEQSKIPFMPPVKVQYNDNICFAQAGLAAIQQFYCRSKASCDLGIMGAPGKDVLALRDGLATYFGDFVGWDSFRRGGIVSNYLGILGRRGAMAKESCAPFEEITLYQISNGLEDGDKDYIDGLTALRDRYLNDKDNGPGSRGSPSCFVCDHLSPGEQIPGLKKFSATVTSALAQQKNLNGFLKNVIVPEECRKSRVQLPKFKAHNFYSEDVNATSAKIKELVGQQKPVIVSFCGSALLSAKEKDCQPHAVTLAGKRKVCCESKCEDEFLMYDSALAMGGGGPLGDGSVWVKEKTVNVGIRKWIDGLKNYTPLTDDQFIEVNKSLKASMALRYRAAKTEGEREWVSQVADSAREYFQKIGHPETLTWLEDN